MTSERW